MFSAQTLKQWTSTLFLMTLAFVSYTPDTFGQAEERTDPGNAVTNSVSDNVYRTGRLSVGSLAPAGLPTDTKLHVKGRFSQEFSGNIGSFSNSDKWASLGESFAPNPNFTNIYGLFSQWGGTGLVTGVKNGNQGLLAWSGANSRLDFDWIDANLTSQTYMTILPNGNVGIGKTNPLHDLDVQGTTEVDYLYPGLGGANNRFIRFGDPSTTWGGFMWNNTNLTYGDGNDFTIFSSGNRDLVLRSGNGDIVLTPNAAGKVAVGTTNPGSYKLFVNGTTGCSLGFWSGSDRRYKKDIKKIEGALDKIQALDGMTYKFKKDEVNGLDFTKAKDINHLGFLAQDVEKVFPELVRKDDAGYYAVNYDGFIPVLVEGMKEQQNTVDAQAETIQVQASTIATQANEIEDLKMRMSRLETLLNDLAANKTERGTQIEMGNTAILKQNAANPFSDKTTIAYELPSNVNNASLVIYNLGGKEMQSYPITTPRGNMTIYATNLENGTYVYAIVANGQTLAQQKMIVQK